MALAGFAVAPIAPAGAATTTDAAVRRVAQADDGDHGIAVVLQVSGLIDPVIASYITEEVRRADADPDVVLVVLQVNSRGSVIGDDDMADLVATIEDARVPVSVWVGPSGSQARGGATRLLDAATVTGIAPGSRIEVTAELAAGLDLSGRTSVGETVGSEVANEVGLVDSPAPSIGDFLLELPEFASELVDGSRQPLTQARFGRLALGDQLFHTVASPAVAYLLFVIGASLIVFELFTAGVGVAGMVGAGSLVLSAYGLAVLPTNSWALAALIATFPAYAIDVQTGVPRFWSAVATLLLVVGSLGLFVDGPPSWITLAAGIIGVVLAMVGGMPAMVRTRFSTPTIGRDWMIGETGVARSAVEPDGIVTVRDSPWRAHTNRATPIAEGDTIRVVAIDGLVLEVEPLEGGAKDYRRH